MSGQKYKRTNFEDDDNTSTGGTPPGVTYDPSIAFKAGASFWQKRSLLERFLLFLVVVLAIVSVVLGALLGAKGSQPPTTTPAPVPQPKPQELCTTKACVTVASTILNSVDEAVDPCDDFFDYACGGWVKNHPIPSGQSHWGTFGVMWKQNQIIMKNALELPLEDSKSESERKARIYYKSCMDPNKTVETLGAQPLLDLLRELGGWSVSDKSGVWDVSTWRFQDTLERVHGYGLSTFFNMWVGEDEKDSAHNILQFDESGLGLARDQYINKTIEDDKVLAAYLEYMTTVGQLLGGEENSTREQMTEVIRLEQRLAEITTPMEDRRDDEKLYHKKTIDELHRISTFMDWLRYVNKMLEITDHRVNGTENVLVYAPEYLSKVSSMVIELDISGDGKRQLNNYMMWHVVKLMATYLSEPFQDAKKAFLKVITGVSGEEEPWRYCTSDADSVLGFAVGAMFVREAFHGDSKTTAEEMIVGIKAAFKQNLPNLEWMDSETRAAAIEKADAVVDKIGFPAYILNATKLDERYQSLNIKENEYYQNNINSLHFTMKRNMDKLRKAPDKKSWSMTPPTVNAYYTPTKNEIVFPAGILQAPFYDRDFPRSLNYGGIGVVMGHELTHGFDDQGREYNKEGILQPWWNNASITKFKERAQCMIDQYSAYKLNDDYVRGKQTLGENIADNGGLKSAYHAYEAWVKANGEEPPLPGITQTHRQMFFLAFAQVWCSNSKPQDDHMSILTDPHSPSRFRVIGPLSNSREFAEQFHCKRGSKMNPTKTCEVW